MNSVRKLTFLLSVIFCLAVGQGCTKKENVYVPGSGGGGPTGPQNEVTGKGNGGNEMKMTFPEIEIKLAAVKPYLHRLFLGLKDLNVAEQLSPGLTDLKDFPELQNLIGLMTRETTEYMNVFGDIAVDNNFAPQNTPCVDIKGEENAAAAGAGDIGGEICFSMGRLQAASIKGADFAVDVMILSLAAHEFGHHYLNSGNPEIDEALVRILQDFVTDQMNKYQGLPTATDVVTASEVVYLDRFVHEARSLLAKAQASNVIQVK